MMLVADLVVGMIDDNPVVLDVASAFYVIIPLSLGFMSIVQIDRSNFNSQGPPMPALPPATFMATLAYLLLQQLTPWWARVLGTGISNQCAAHLTSTHIRSHKLKTHTTNAIPNRQNAD
jgi:hypothetical protein